MVEEFHTAEEDKQALRACAEILLVTSEDYATATMLATILLANKPEGFTPSEDFLDRNPDNHPREYSGPATYLAFFLQYLAEKARSAKDIADEQEKIGKKSSGEKPSGEDGKQNEFSAIRLSLLPRRQ